MATALVECITEEQGSIVLFLRIERFNSKELHKKCFRFMLGSVYHIKRFHLSDRSFADDEEVETEVRKWLRQQSKDLYAADFDALVKRQDKCINVGGEYVDKCMFFPASNIIYFTFCIHL
jgi:hypothetical protein